jgi:hypothetical protein
MEMAAMVQLSNLGPLVFSDVVNFALFRSVVRVLAAHSIDVVFSFVVKSSVEMR